MEKQLTDQIAFLTAENEKLKAEKTAAENMLEYERHKYQRQLSAQESGIIEHFLNAVGLELQAIYDLTEYLEESDKRRIRRRLNRINDILLESD